jgi:hypothetical protein
VVGHVNDVDRFTGKRYFTSAAIQRVALSHLKTYALFAHLEYQTPKGIRYPDFV